MKQAVPYFGRFLSKLVLEIIPGALVSVFAAYLLSMLHLGAEPATTPSPSVAAVQNDGLSADERRELTRQMLKERRENPEEPAEVKPVPSLRPGLAAFRDRRSASRSRCRAARRRHEAPCRAASVCGRDRLRRLRRLRCPVRRRLAPRPRLRRLPRSRPPVLRLPLHRRPRPSPPRCRLRWWWRLAPFRRRRLPTELPQVTVNAPANARPAAMRQGATSRESRSSAASSATSSPAFRPSPAAPPTSPATP